MIHEIKGSSKEKDIIKYKIGMKVDLYVEKHIFKHTKNSKEILPKEYYSNVTYNEEIKALIVTGFMSSFYTLTKKGTIISSDYRG